MERPQAEQEILLALVAATSSETGERFFRALVENVSRTLGVSGAWVTEYEPERRRLRALAFRWKEGWIDDYQYDIQGTPCAPVVEEKRLVHIPDRVLELFPDDPDLAKLGGVSYMGVPLVDAAGTVLGHLAVLDNQPQDPHPSLVAAFRLFAARASAELQRLHAEIEVRSREEKLRRLVDSAMDAIVEVDRDLLITLCNPAAEKAFACRAAEMRGRDVRTLFDEHGAETLLRLSREFGGTGRPASTWIGGGLVARTAAGATFPAEATLSTSGDGTSTFFTLILRDVRDKRDAEQRIDALTEEAGYLRQELESLRGAATILGDSEAMRRVLQDVMQVGPTDASVLVTGESGTGKELVAQAIHAASARRQRSLVKVNCAALPADLIESELFGHERGAFTGATQKREGRFALADGGTIFLDEIAELRLDLQGKLLRVLQEGSFEPVGSSHTRSVDVRVIAATNRDLSAEIAAGRFRADLYYRLAVFPIQVPPLRERGEDIALLAANFAQRAAQRLGRRLEPLGSQDRDRLLAYSWPGNVRELQNVIERAVITARDTRLNLERALPEIRQPAIRLALATDSAENAEVELRTLEDLERLERDNMLRALERAGWKVAGTGGAAELLGMKPSTFSSRMKALGIERRTPR